MPEQKEGASEYWWVRYRSDPDLIIAEKVTPHRRHLKPVVYLPGTGATFAPDSFDWIAKIEPPSTP